MKLVLALVYQLRPRAGRQSLSLHRFAAGARGWGLLNRLMRLRSYETCFAIGLLASPPCGAAVTFFAAAKKVTKESSFFRQQSQTGNALAIPIGPAPKCRPQRTLGAWCAARTVKSRSERVGTAVIHPFSLRWTRGTFVAWLRFAVEVENRWFSVVPVVRAKRGRTGTQRIPLCWTARGVSACARQARWSFGGDT